MAIVGDAYIELHALTGGFQAEVEKALRDLDPLLRRTGQNMGKNFANAFGSGSGKGMFSNFLREAKAAKDAFNGLIRKGYMLGPVLAGVASTLSDLVSGLFALGSAVGAAAPAISVLGGSIAALGQGFLTAKVAMGGIGKAIQAISNNAGKPADTKGLEDARRRLAQVYQRTAEQMASANDKVREAQISLNAAYQKGYESLQQLGFTAEEAALAQEKAAIQLERARETLARSQDLPVNDRGRREAEIAFKEAELNYRKTTDQVSDLAKQQEYAAQTGIEGTQEVLDAKNELYKAEQDRAKVERDNAQDIVDAQRSVAEALAQSQKSASAVSEAMKKLSPEAQEFAKYIASIKDEFLKLRYAAGRQMFGQLTTAIQLLMTKLLPVLEPLMENMGRVVGYLGRQFAKVATAADNLGKINRIFGPANNDAFRNIVKTFLNMFDAILSVLDALRPLTVQFTAYTAFLSRNLKMSIGVQNATGQLTEKFQKAADIAVKLGTFVKTTWNAFKELGGAAKDSGVRILEAMTGAMEKLRQFAIEGKKTGELQAMFERIATNFIAVGTVLGKIVAAFFVLGGNSGVAAFAKALEPLPGIFATIAQNITGTGAVFGQFIVTFAKVLGQFTESGGIEMFFKVLTAALKVVVALFSNEIVMKVFLFMAALHGVTLALGVIGRVGQLAFKILIGKLAVIPMAAANATRSLLGLAAAEKVAGAGGAASAGMLMRMKASMNAFSLQLVSGIRGLRAFNQAGGFTGASLAGVKTSLSRNITLLKAFTYEALRSAVTAIRQGFAWLFSSKSVDAFGRALLAPIKLSNRLVMSMYRLIPSILGVNGAMLANPAVWIAAAIAALVAVLVLAYKASKPLQDAISDLGNSLMSTLGEGIKLVSDQFKGILPSMKSVQDVFKAIGDFIAKWVIPPIKLLLTMQLKLWFAAIVVAINYFKIAWNFLAFIIKTMVFAFTGLFNLLTGKKDPFASLRGAFKDFATQIYDVINAGIDVINFLNIFGEDIPHVAEEADKLSESQKNLKKYSDEYMKSLVKESKAAKNLTKEYGNLRQIKDRINGLATDVFTSATSEARALAQTAADTKGLVQAQKDLQSNLKDSKGDIIYTDSALAEFAGTYLDAMENAIKAGKSQSEVQKIMDQGRASFIENAKSIGKSATEAERLATAYGLTDEVIKKTFVISGVQDLKDSVALLESMNAAMKVATTPIKVAITGTKSKDYEFGYDYSNVVDASTRNFMAQAIRTQKAKLEQAMTLKFGKGQTKKDPLFVEVTNGKAFGGPVRAGNTYLVGENGPEIFRADTSGTIIPNTKIAGAGSGGPVINMTVNPSPGMDERELAAVASRQIAWGLRRGA